MKDITFHTLTHYIVDPGYNVHVTEDDAAAIQKELGDYFDIDYAGTYKDRPFSLNRKTEVPFPPELRARFWKQLYKAEVATVHRIYDAFECFKKTLEDI